MDLYAALKGCPPEFALCNRVYPDGSVIVPVADVSHPQNTTCRVFDTPVVIEGMTCVPEAEPSVLPPLDVFGATS